MLNKLIYKLSKVYVYDYVEKSRNLKIECKETRYGYFDSIIAVESFIRKHNHDDNCFFITRTYIFNPTHGGQTESYLTERTYDSKCNILCDCPTHHFVVNFNEMFGNEHTRFTGRNNPIFKKGDTAWFYDEIDEILYKCKIGEIPFNEEQAKNYDCLEWYDDSYLVYPMPHKENIDNHQHIVSCMMFTDDFVKEIKTK